MYFVLALLKGRFFLITFEGQITQQAFVLVILSGLELGFGLPGFCVGSFLGLRFQ